jgi:hypothetical protein
MQTEEKAIVANYCASCGHMLTGKYCSQCGEKVLKAEDKSVKHFFEEFFHMLTHADNKFLRSLKYLLFRPGFLTKEYLAGRRKLYASPLSLFFIGNLIYLLLSPVDALNTHYQSQVQAQGYSRIIAPVGAARMKEKGWTMQQMEEHYNAKSGKASKMLMILLVFIFSVPVAILFYRRDLYYSDHLVFATEFISFLIYGVLTILPIILICTFLLLRFLLHDNSLTFDPNSILANILLALIMGSYLFIAANRVYKQSWTLPRVLLLTVCTGFTVLLYRFILFYATLWML